MQDDITEIQALGELTDAVLYSNERVLDQCIKRIQTAAGHELQDGNDEVLAVLLAIRNYLREAAKGKYVKTR